MKHAYASLRGTALNATLTATLFAVLSASFIRPAAAQLAPEPAASAPTPTTLGSVLVTATKRSTALQKTPVSITAITGDDLQQRGVTSVSSLVGEVPGIAIKSSGPGQTEFQLRGLASSGGSSPTTGFYLDDTPMTAPAAAQNGKVVIDPNLYDLERIEVLRGPQGTLYGSGSMGGTIKLVTRAPDLRSVDASAQLVVSGTEGGGLNHAQNVMLNLPLVTDTLAARLVASRSHTSGWIDRVVVGDFPVAAPGTAVRGNVAAAPVLLREDDVNDNTLTGARLTLLYRPTDRLKITPMLFWQAIRQGGPSTFDSDPGTLAHYEAFDQPEPFKDRFSLASVNVDYRFDGFDLTSATSSWRRSQRISQDQDENFQLAFGLPSVYPAQGGIGSGPLYELDKTRQFAQELRLTSTTDSPLQWLVGVFYSRFVSDWIVDSQFPDAAPLFGTSNLIYQSQPTTIRQKALFGEASYALTPKLKATLGLRYYAYDSTVDTVYSGFASATGSDAVASNSARQKETGVNPKVNLSYQASDALMVYGTVAKGFRPGGGNQPIPVDPATALGASCLAALQAFGQNAAPATFKSDNVWSYEVGAKASIDQRTTVNGAMYYQRWAGVQQTVALSCGFPYTDNTGKAEVYGAELELRTILHRGLIASASTGYTDARLAADVPQTGAREGDRLQNVSKWTASTALDYSMPINDELTATGRLSYAYVGPRVDATFSKNQLPSYSLVNLRAGLFADHWSATLFASNLLDRRTSISNTPSLSVNPSTFNRVSTHPPRTVGIDFSYQFQ